MPLTPDGRIRSKDIGTGEVNSRVIDNLRSSNYDGDPESPDLDSGSQGWLILKNGKVVFNEGTFRGDVAIAGNLEVSGTDGILVFDGGDITVNSGGDIVINGGQLTAGPTTLDSSGLQVGTDVTIDSTGLHVEGGLVQGVWPFALSGSASNVSMTTTPTDFVTVQIDPPNWVQQLFVLSIGRISISNNSGAAQRVDMGVTNDNGGASEQRVFGGHHVNNGQTQQVSMPNREEIALSPAGRTVDVVVDASLDTGTNSSNLVTVSVIGFGVRTVFA